MKIWAEAVDDPTYLFDNVLPFYQRTIIFTPPKSRSEAPIQSYNRSAFSSSGEPLHVSYPTYPMQFSIFAKQAFTEAGLPELEDFNSGSLIGHQFSTMTIRPRDQTRSSSESAFLGAFNNLSNLTVYQKSLATKILFDEGNRAVGVQIKNTWSSTLKVSKEVILAAGAFQSPQLLMVSGVGPIKILQQHGIRVIANRPGVGQSMWDHIFFGPSYPVNVNTYTRLAQRTDQLVFQILNWFLWKKGILSNPSTDYLAFEKIPTKYRSDLSTQDQLRLSWFPADWPEVEVRT